MEEIWGTGKCVESKKGKMNSSPSSTITVLRRTSPTSESQLSQGEDESSEPDDL